MTVRVRFAPSPTGYLHLGGARTAIFNWLFAHHNNGQFLLRIEDTDTERSKPEYTQALLDVFGWLGMPSEEPVLIQTSRLGEHKKLIEQLVREGKAYYCLCSQELLEKMKEEQIAQGKTPRYDGRCRVAQITPSANTAVRFKLPFVEGPITFHDLVHGPITFDAQQLDDFIIARSDGMPMYNFVVVADDAFMGITQVIRGEEHIPNTPKQILLYQALGFQVPEFAHIPMILSPSGEKLSKRHGAVAVNDYRNQGYLADAVINYLVRLGWSHGDQELFSRDELVKFFTLEGVNKSASAFDTTKLDWVNGVYLRAKDDAYLLEQITTYVAPEFSTQVPHFSQAQLLTGIALYKSRVKNLRELVDELIQLHNPAQPKPEDLQLWDNAQTKELIQQFVAELSQSHSFTVESITTLGKSLCNKLNLKIAALAQPVRLALTGKTASPGVYELIAFLGKEVAITRLQAFVNRLS